MPAAIDLQLDKARPPLATLITAQYLQLNNLKLNVTYGNKNVLKVNNELILTSDHAICRYLAMAYPKLEMYGANNLKRAQVDHWLDFTASYFENAQDLSSSSVGHLNIALAPAAYLLGANATIADFAVWSALHQNPKWSGVQKNTKVSSHVLRWYNFCSHQPSFKAAVNQLPSKEQTKIQNKEQSKQGLKSNMEDGGKFISLPNAEDGKVVVRFPPEASGYLHIGHAKAALMNQYYKELHKGRLIMRFDDTNPAKENAHYEEIILEDIKLLQLTPDVYTRTSDHFETIMKYGDQMIREKKAFCDNTAPEELQKLREQKLPSPNRENSVEKNFAMWEEMKKGTDAGRTCCMRAIIDYKSDNGCMRDPVLYRCRSEPHLVTGDKYKAYPTYDFACPIVDSVEGVTHALRTTEYHDRDPQYFWILKALGLREPYIYDYSRLALVNTVLSKRKLTHLVDQGFVDGWDDPRMPTVRGVVRRGMTIKGLREFIVAQGSSKANVHMEWDKIWSFNKKVIDPVSPRYTALLKDAVVPVHMEGAKDDSAEHQCNPKNADVGSKTVYYGQKVLIEGEDAALLKEGDLATFINWGNARINGIARDASGKVTSINAKLELDNKDFKKTAKLTWLVDRTDVDATPTVCVHYDHIITKAVITKNDDFKQLINHNTKTDFVMLGDPCLRHLQRGDVIQLQRRGYYICDQPYSAPSRHTSRATPCVLLNIPDGHTKNMPATNYAAKDGPSPPSQAKSSPVKQSATSQSSSASELAVKIVVQGDKIRQLKSEKADKAVVKAEVDQLLLLKAQYKETAGVDYKPQAASSQQPQQQKQAAAMVSPPAPAQSSDAAEVLKVKISEQGDKVRSLKSSGANKAVVKAEVDQLLLLKAQYKETAGVDYKPQAASSQQPQQQKQAAAMVSPPAPAPSSDAAEALKVKISEQGDKVRSLKSSGADKPAVDEAVKVLLSLKADYKALTGDDFPAASGSSSKRDKKSKKKDQQQPQRQEKAAVAKATTAEQDAASAGKKVTRLGLEAKKEEALSDWYSQVITKSEMIEYYDISGCYILRAWAFGIWERIQAFFDGHIKRLGVENCYFPMFVSQQALEKEKEHISDFAPEVAWVTKSGQSDLAEHIAIRPTSETVMYPAYAKWIKSHRDLPLRLNQWCNVVRWEFKHPQPFLRTREFLWQEGHTAFATRDEATKEVYEILELYAQIYSDLLAIPVVKGKKTEKEKFAGGDFTTTCEAYIEASGRAIQGATSHHLGQNFSKMFDIVYEDPNNPDSKEKCYVHQNSWGITTRTIGVMVMVHGDNRGIVLPPKVANIQVVVVPCGITASTRDEERQQIVNTCSSYVDVFVKQGIRAHADLRDNYSPGWKFNHWELKGVPLRVEVGPRDIKTDQITVVRRDNLAKAVLPKATAAEKIVTLLDTVQKDMLSRATEQLNNNIVVTKSFADFVDLLDKKKLIMSPFCGAIACEEKIKKDSAREESAEPGAPSMGAKSLCIPFEQPETLATDAKCIHPDCQRTAKEFTLFGRSY